MSTLLAYSGLTTKIRAMESHLLKDDDYRRISELSTVAEVISFLKQIPGYREVLAHVDENHIHRGEVEPYLYDSIYWGFIRIYRFANQEQKKYLDLYFQRYEIFIIKRYFHRMEDHKEYDPSFGNRDFDRFFRRHTQLNLEKLTAARNMEELIRNLQGTVYYSPLQHLREQREFSSFDYEMALDMSYFTRIWKSLDKVLKGDGLESLTKAYGSKFDLLNLDWIYRSKKYYRLNEGQIYDMLIPVHYRLKNSELVAMVGAAGTEEFGNILAGTYYGDKFRQMTPETLEEMYVIIMKYVLTREARNHPYSAATIYSYLYKKEHEIDKVTTAIECIRYHMDSTTTYQYILKS